MNELVTIVQQILNAYEVIYNETSNTFQNLFGHTPVENSLT